MLFKNVTKKIYSLRDTAHEMVIPFVVNQIVAALEKRSTENKSPEKKVKPSPHIKNSQLSKEVIVFKSTSVKESMLPYGWNINTYLLDLNKLKKSSSEYLVISRLEDLGSNLKDILLSLTKIYELDYKVYNLSNNRFLEKTMDLLSSINFEPLTVVPKSPRKIIVTKEILAKAKYQREQGFSYKHIAKELNLNCSTLYSHLKEKKKPIKAKKVKELSITPLTDTTNSTQNTSDIIKN